MYLPEWAQKFKEPKTEIRIIGGHCYKYQVEYRYNKEKKRTDKITIGLLGKITEQDGFIPSDKHLLKEQANAVLIQQMLISKRSVCTVCSASF